MRRNILLFLLGLYASMLFSVPAKRERCTLTLPDGSTIQATWTGDEAMHFYLTDDGRCLQCDDKGFAHFVDAEQLHQRWKAKTAKRQAFRAKRFASSQRKAKRAMTGSKRGLVILVQFPDVPFYYTNSTFQNFFNEIDYYDDINVGSVRDYFLSQSYGQFDFTFDVIGPITMPDSLYHYGRNNPYGDDRHPAVMVKQAIEMIDDEVDFSEYDWDKDGEVEQIFIIHSGYDEAQSRMNDHIWSHAWTLTEAIDEGDGDGPVTVDGVVVDSYATSAELRGRANNFIAGIGTACHEFSHCFGLPDFYDTDGKNFGMDTWSLMDYGEYNGNGGCPAGFTSYERMFCGWLEPSVLTEPVRVVGMPALTSSPSAYILRNSGKSDEYYLFENRQKQSWDKYLGGHGMLILHVDYDSLAWAENAVNVFRSHQRMTIIPADNILYSGTLAGDTWPQPGKTELTDNSTPAAILYNPNAEGNLFMNHSITEISESGDGLIGFVFDEQALGIEAVDEGQGIKDNAIYNLSGQQIVNGQWSNGKLFKGINIINGKKYYEKGNPSSARESLH